MIRLVEIRPGRCLRRAVALVLIAGTGAAGAVAQNNSLFNRSNSPARPAPTSQPAAAPAGPGASSDPTPRNATLLAFSPIAVAPPKPQKFGVNSLITIIIREDKTAKTDAKLQSEKKWDLNSELTKWFRLNEQDHLVAQNFPDPPGMKLTYDDKYDGRGKIDRTDSLVTRVQATVIDVKPNGSLVLEAKKRVEQDEEIYTVTLTGDCRSEDVTATNTVLSTQIANADISIKHSGLARDETRRGWLKRALDFLRPL